MTHVVRVAGNVVVRETVARLPRPTRTAGGWMITRPDAPGLALRQARFELDETSFVQRFLAPGMSVADAGAHSGYYTLLARRAVGGAGTVIAFEPSARERRRLTVNLRLNRLDDVHVVGSALGESIGETEFYVVHGLETGFGGRLRPGVEGRIERVTVPLTTLDAALASLGVAELDLLKVDVEGGELDVFRGAEGVLATPRPPVVLCEISDERSESWGHRGLDVRAFLAERGFEWFALEHGGRLVALPAADAYHGNFVAVHANRIDDLALARG